MTSPPSTAPDAGRAPALAAVVLTSILWGTTGTAASFAPEVPSFAIAAVSLGLGAILQALIALPALRAARARILARPGLLAVGALSVFVYPRAFGVGAYMALVPMFLGYVLFGYGLTRLRTSTVTLLTLIEPGVAALLAVLVVGERLSLLGWAGLTIIAASLLVLVSPAPRARPAD